MGGNLKNKHMKKITLLMLALTTIGCEYDTKPVQEVTPESNAINVIAYAPGEYVQDSIYYCLTTRYQDCRITDYGTAHFIDSIIPIRYQDAIYLQKEFDNLKEHAENPEPNAKASK
jgi:hypothetical protein